MGVDSRSCFYRLQRRSAFSACLRCITSDRVATSDAVRNALQPKRSHYWLWPNHSGALGATPSLPDAPEATQAQCHLQHQPQQQPHG